VSRYPYISHINSADVDISPSKIDGMHQWGVDALTIGTSYGGVHPFVSPNAFRTDRIQQT